MRSLLLLLAVPAALAADYELVASGKECQTSGSWKDWKGSGKTLDQCRAEVLADWDCDPTYFEFANDANCRCAQEEERASAVKRLEEQIHTTSIDMGIGVRIVEYAVFLRLLLLVVLGFEVVFI